ncbi:MAG: anthranilate synthase component I family protein [Limisphaerales bacterium]
MYPLIQQVPGSKTAGSIAHSAQFEPDLVFLHTSLFDTPHSRYSFLTARPFLKFRSFGARCELASPRGARVQFGDPWQIMAELLSRYELLDEQDLPFPLGGCFGYWGYELKQFVEPKLARRALNDLELPDCQLGFYDSLVAFDHRLDQAWVISTGLREDGSRSDEHARAQAEWWIQRLRRPSTDEASTGLRAATGTEQGGAGLFASTLSRAEFVRRVESAQSYIRAGDIYQVNLSHRLRAPLDCSGWRFFQHLNATSPAPFSAFLNCGEFQLASSSPELFLRMSGAHVETRPIKGTRPRSRDGVRDAQLAYELQTSSKEAAELVMITDLLRNDLGKCCEYGSVQTPDLLRLERFPQVQHLVSTVEGRLRSGVTHVEAFAACFPGGSVTGAPKFRAMEIIEALEPVSRGPYTGALGYLGFNRESQLSIIIRAAVCTNDLVHFSVGAGIVADSDPEAEYEETLVKARGFIDALGWEPRAEPGPGPVRGDAYSSAPLSGRGGNR